MTVILLTQYKSYPKRFKKTNNQGICRSSLRSFRFSEYRVSVFEILKYYNFIMIYNFGSSTGHAKYRKFGQLKAV